MSNINYVKIYYGPTYCFSSYIHRPQKLNGLRDILRRLGYRAELVPVNSINVCKIEMSGLDIFQCNLNNLLFNVPTVEDEVAQRAVAAVQQASKLLIRNCNNHWTRMLLEDKVLETIAHGRLKLKLQHQYFESEGHHVHATKEDRFKLGPTPSWPFPLNLILDQESQDSEHVQDQDQQHMEQEQQLPNQQQNPDEPQPQVDQQQVETDQHSLKPNHHQFEPDELSLELNQQRLDISRLLIETSLLQI